MYKWVINGELNIIYKDDIPTLVEEHMGGDATRIVKDLVKESNYNKHELDFDLTHY